MRPKCILTVNGAPVAGLFWEKLVRLTVHDHEGTKSDKIDILLEDGPPAFLAIPQEGDIIECWLGYEAIGGAAVPAMDHMGSFKVDDVEVSAWDWSMSIKGSAAEMRDTAKQHRRRHHDKKTFKDVAEKIAGEHGWQPQIDGEIGAHFEEWWGQENESDIHWLERQAERLGGMFTVKNNRMIVAKRGAGLTAGGTAIVPVVIVPTMLKRNSLKVTFGKREKHGKVKGEWHNTATGKREQEEDASDGASQATYTHRHAFSSKASAKAGAKSRAKSLKTAGVRTSCTIEGNPYVKAGCPMTYAGMRPGIDGLPFIIEEATHTFGKQPSYLTAIKAKQKADGDGGK